MRKSLAGVDLSIIIIISIVLIACGCASPHPADHATSTLPSDKYVALYEEYDIDGTVLEGNGTLVNMPVPCPFPHPFDYNGTQGFREQYPAVNDDLKVMYGSYRVLSSPAGGYSTARYRGIYGLPYMLDSGLIIAGIDADGMINASYDNRTVTIKTGDTWRSPVATEVRNESHYIADNFSTFSTSSMAPFLMRYNYSYMVENKGVFPKSNLL